MIHVTTEQKTLLRMHCKGRIKYTQQPMGIKHPTTGKMLKMTTLNIPPSAQVTYSQLYRKGLISGDKLGKGKITAVGKAILSKR